MKDKRITDSFISHAAAPVYFTGSNKNIRRVVYEDPSGRCWVIWYGTLVEVKHGSNSWYTVEKY